MEKFDFIAIGDITTDAFIRLKEAEVHCDIDRQKCQICMRFADKIPFESVAVVPAVGNSPNAAVAAAKLGLRSALVVNLGDDRNGDDCLEALKQAKVDTRFITRQPGKKTNYHYVLWYLDERTILIKHELFDYDLPDINSPRWIYLSSAGENSLPFHDQLADYLIARPEIKMAFQPGTFQIKFGKDRLAKIYERTDVFFCNVEEARRILGSEEPSIVKLMVGLNALGPKLVVVTDGPQGAYLYGEGEAWFLPAYPDIAPPFERTGAGDAFSSTFTAALALGKTAKEALQWGPINSMSVVQKIGAQAGLLTRAELEDYLAKAPADYLPKKI